MCECGQCRDRDLKDGLKAVLESRNKIGVIKGVRAVLGIPLKEALTFVQENWNSQATQLEAAQRETDHFKRLQELSEASYRKAADAAGVAQGKVADLEQRIRVLEQNLDDAKATKVAIESLLDAAEAREDALEEQVGELERSLEEMSVEELEQNTRAVSYKTVLRDLLRGEED